MLRTIRNLIVNIMAAFISDKGERHKFRNKYKRKSKFRKLRDDNRKLFNDNQAIKQQLDTLSSNLNKVNLQVLKINSLLFSVSNVATDRPRVYLSIACMALNEGPYLKEWIEYHRLVGVERFYYYDNGSDDNTLEVLEPYIKEGVVVYHKADGYQIHLSILNDAVCKYRHQTYWLALIDLDEFIVPVEKDNIPEVLMEFDQYPSVGINWVCFDTNGHKTKPTEHGGLVTANYTRVNKNYDIRANREIKSIVNPRKIMYVRDFHCGMGTGVTENFEPADYFLTKYHSSKKLRINHYIIKSKEEFLQKYNKQKQLSKRDRIKVFNDHWRDNDFTDEFEFKDGKEDLVIQKYMPKLKVAMGIQE